MSQRAELLLDRLVAIPELLLYLLIGAAAAIENLIPPFPGDVAVVVGGVLAGAGSADPTVLFLVVWLSNAASALLVYGLGRRYGAGFLGGPIGRFLLAPRQVETLAVAYRRFGFPIIFFSRFLPVFRPVVPVFAGVSRVGFWKTALPILAASAVWYGFLVYLGSVAGRNWGAVMSLLDRVGGGLWAVAVLAIVLLGRWWWKTRSEPAEPPRP